MVTNVFEMPTMSREAVDIRERILFSCQRLSLLRGEEGNRGCHGSLVYDCLIGNALSDYGVAYEFLDF